MLGVILARPDLSCTELKLYADCLASMGAFSDFRWAAPGSAEPLEGTSFPEQLGHLLYNFRSPV